jgi:CubicO group peptidase (beta-lactamase class C family)
MRFQTMMLNEGMFNGRQILKTQTVRTARSNLMEPGVLQGRNGYGAGMSVILPGGETPGREPPGSYNWFGIAGTQMWMDPVNKVAVNLMLQLNPTSFPVRAEVRDAAYKDIARLKA